MVNSLNRPPRQMSPGRSALTQQLQLGGPQRPQYSTGQLSQDPPNYFGHDPIETG